MLLPLVASLAVLAAPSPSDLNGLLARAGQISAEIDANEHSLSRTCTDRAEQLDGDGKPTQVFEEITRTEWVRGTEAKAILYASQDGKDVTVSEQEKLAAEQDEKGSDARERGNYGGIDFSNPLLPQAQPRYRFTVVAAHEGDGDLVRVRFEPAGEPTSSLNSGEVLIDPSDGLPVSIRSHPSAYPSFVAFVHFQARYTRSAAGPVRSDFSVEGAGGFLFVQKHYREHIRCRDFVRPDSQTSAR